jgi:translation initiation factor 3 subunit I
LKYNRDGDLIFSAAKDATPCVWYSDNGERVGTYKGHTGAVWSLDVSCTHFSLIFLYPAPLRDLSIFARLF